MTKLPSRNELNELLGYDPDTGELRWKARPLSAFRSAQNPLNAAGSWNAKNAGNIAFTAKSAAGYRVGRIHDRLMYAHRVIWKIVHGVDPIEVDHINGNRGDNRLANLRAVTRTENARNVPRPRNNTSGRIGVTWNADCRKWRAKIGHGATAEYLGLFTTLEEASAARAAAESRLGFHPNHGRQATAERMLHEARGRRHG